MRRDCLPNSSRRIQTLTRYISSDTVRDRYSSRRWQNCLRERKAQARAPVWDAVHLMGLWPVGLVDALRATLLTGLLFLGPLFLGLVAEAGWRDWAKLGPVKEVWNEWTSWRNIVAVRICIFFFISSYQKPTKETNN